MERYTFSNTESGLYNPKINSGTPMFRWFEYVIEPDEQLDGVEIQIGPEPDKSTERWFADLKRGIERGLVRVGEFWHRELVGLRITITKVICHDIATTIRACEHVGSGFASDIVARSENLRKVVI